MRSSTMSESLADRLKRLASQRTSARDAENAVRESQQRANVFISDHARPEFEKFQARLKGLIEEVNPTLSDLPKYQFWANGMIQQGNYVAMLHFAKPILNGLDNRLQISFGPHPQGMYFSTEPPEARRFQLHAGCNDAIDEIRWIGDFGELSTDQLAEVVLEGLTKYYLDHTAN